MRAVISKPHAGLWLSMDIALAFYSLPSGKRSKSVVSGSNRPILRVRARKSRQARQWGNIHKC